MDQHPPEDFHIRVAAPEDHAAISALFEASYAELMCSHYAPSVLETALPLLTRANPLLLASGTFFVAKIRNGRTVGCGGWTRERPGTGDTMPGLGHIRHFATHPGYSGRGVGRSLYKECERQARSAGMRRLECYASLNAAGFYASLGFEERERIDIAIGREVSLPAVRMLREIEQGT